MASLLSLCRTPLLSDIMDAQACSHSSKLIYQWVKVKKQTSPQPMSSGKGMCKLLCRVFFFPHNGGKNQVLKLGREAKFQHLI